MLIFWVLLIFRIVNVGLKFLVTRKRLTYHAAITDAIACRPLNYGVWNACEGSQGAGGTGTGSADPQQMLIFWRFPMFSTVYIGFEVKHLLLVHATKYGVINVSR